MDQQQYFNQIANKWDEFRKQLFPDSLKDFAVNKSGAIAGQFAADLGAGTGFISEALLQNNLKVIAIDESPEMVQILKNKFRNHNFKAFTGIDSSLPIESNSQDFAFANMYLHHVENPQIAITEMARIVKPGGKVFITDLDEHKSQFLAKEHHDKWLGFKRSEIKKWFENSGLKNVIVDCTNETCCSTSNINPETVASLSIFYAMGTK